MRIAALIVAAGRGTRFGGEIPKQYVPIHGTCAFRRSIDRFLSCRDVHHVQGVIHGDDRGYYEDALHGLHHPQLAAPVTGGATRAQSVLRGLMALENSEPDAVLIHDAARPFVTDQVIHSVIAALRTAEGAFAALPVVDALWRAEGDVASTPVARDGLWRAQTPQGFRFSPLLEAHKCYEGDAADDVEIARAAGLTVKVVQGASDNFKITTPEDLVRAERIAAQSYGTSHET